MDKPKVLVTGAAGFIGSHLCSFLLERGYAVVGIDNFLTGQRGNLAPLTSRPHFQFIEADITQPLPPLHPCRYVCHLASPASPVDYGQFPLETLRVNSQGTWQLLELGRGWGSRFLLASTSEVYGDPLEHPQRESYWGNVNPVGPRSCYDEGKRFAEALTLTYHRQHRLSVGIARIFNTYGPGMKREDGRVIPNFICQALAGEPLTIFGDGKQTRSFCYVSDLVRGLTLLLESEPAGPVNLGNPEEHTILEMAQLIKKLTKSNSPLTYAPLPQDDPRQRRPDISRAKERLGWQPGVKLEEGLKQTIAYFQTGSVSPA